MSSSSSNYQQRVVRRNVSSSLEHNNNNNNNNNNNSIGYSNGTSDPNGHSYTKTRSHHFPRTSYGTMIGTSPTTTTTTPSSSSSSSTTTTAKCRRVRGILYMTALLVVVLYVITNHSYSNRSEWMVDIGTFAVTNHDLSTTTTTTPLSSSSSLRHQESPPSTATTTTTILSGKDLSGFDTIYQRARQHSQLCTDLEPSRPFDTRSILPFHNDTVASLPAFGIIHAIQSYHHHHHPNTASDNNNVTVWPTCAMPPTTECAETQLTVVFMAYNPDRLGITRAEIRRMFDPHVFFGLVKEVILVWNGERHIDESQDGRAFLEDAMTYPIRIVYPLKMGFPNDLMNRYHPQVVQPTTKAILYYDDDGPFYPYPAIQGGFELWKRHARAQIGAMARQITYSPRQQEYKVSLLGAETAKKAKPADDVFVSHCTNVDDTVDYEFHFFANYDANMVLPSGSMLHANYLCYLWHPIFDEIRKFVLLHPVHPDDMTVSMIVSQLAGVAPRVYSRRLDRIQPKKERRLTEQFVTSANNTIDDSEHRYSDELSDMMGIVPLSEQQRHRSLMFSICWDCGAGMTEMKQYWAELRTEAVNALVRYFGSINSGSIGWCTTDSEYYNVNKDGRCWPTMAKQGMLPWMNSDGTPKATCP